MANEAKYLIKFVQKDLNDDQVLFSDNDLIRFKLNTKLGEHQDTNDTKNIIRHYIKNNRMFSYDKRILYFNIGYSGDLNISSNGLKSNIPNNPDTGYHPIQLHRAMFPICSIIISDQSDEDDYYIVRKIFKNIELNIADGIYGKKNMARLTSAILNINHTAAYKLFSRAYLEFLYFSNNCFYWLSRLCRVVSPVIEIKNDDCISIQASIDEQNNHRLVVDLNTNDSSTAIIVTAKINTKEIYNKRFDLSHDIYLQEHYVKNCIVDGILEHINSLESE